jgi:Flp pilus assembly protein TadB
MVGFGLLARHIINSATRHSGNEAEERLLSLIAREADEPQFAATGERKRRHFFGRGQERGRRERAPGQGSPTVARLASRLEHSGWFDKGEGKGFIERLDDELVVAGIRYKMTPYQALAVALLVWSIGVILPTFLKLAIGLPTILYVASVVAFALYPWLKLRGLKAERQDSLKMELPVFIQQLRMLLSSKMTNLDDAIARVVRNAEIDPYDSALAREFGQAQTEYRLGGVNREEALRAISKRTRVVAVQNLVEAIIQGLRTGTDMAVVLEEYGKQARETWRQDMRAFMGKKEPLITIGMVITMFGGFILIAAPLLINLTRTLSSF